jgi:hypothetical protein
MTNRALCAVLPLALLVTACEASKSSTPLSPSVAAPIPGVDISAPKILEPANGTSIPDDKQPVTLLIENAWSTGVRPLSLLVEVATDAAFSNTVFSRDGLTPGDGGRTTVRLPDPLASGRSYYWRSRAADGANSGPYSDAANFAVYTPVVIAAPIPLSPINGVTTATVRPRAVWVNAQRTGPAGKIAYLVEVSDTDSFANTLAWDVDEIGGGQTTFDAPGDLPPNRVWYWHVRAYDPGNNGPWSNTQVFKTPAPAVVPPPPGGGGGGGGTGAACTPKPTTGLQVIACVQSKYPEKLVAGVSGSQRLANMEFLRDRVIETGICGGMDLGWNLKRGGPAVSIDAIVWRHGFDDIIDIGLAYDDTSRPLQLQWISVDMPFYKAYTPRPTCQ